MSEAVFDPSLKKKKKSSKKAPDFAAESPSGGFDADAAASKVKDLSLEGATEEFEFKKKKKKSKPANTVDDFEAALARAGVEDAANEAESGEANGEVAESLSGRYEKLLSRFFDILRENNPEMAGDRSGIKYKIPPPIVGRDGNKKTLFSNIKLIADKMHRPTEHVIHFMFTELGTSGSVDGSERLVIKGRFQQGQIEGVLRRYILEYVTCKTCKSVNTRLTKENRLYFLVCNSCGSRRSVQSIKAGYQAVTRASRRAKQQ